MMWAECVGRKYKAFGGEYACLAWNPRKGLLMKLTGGEERFLDRKVGDEVWVSERAIDRTYHTLR